MTSTPEYLTVSRTNVGAAQVMGLDRRIKERLRDRDVFEVWMPEGCELDSFRVLPRLSAAIVTAEQGSGTVRAATALALAPPTAAPEQLVPYRDAEAALRLLERGWNAGLQVLQVFPSLATPGETKQAALSRLFDAAAFAVACAHDGEAAQILALAASPEHVWQRLSDAATSLRITPRDQDR